MTHLTLVEPVVNRTVPNALINMPSQDAAVEQEQGFLSHLIELRDRLLKMVLAVGLLFCGLFWFSQEIYTALAAPLLRHLPNSQMIAIDVAAPFFIPFKLTLMLCVFLAVPYLLYQAIPIKAAQKLG